MRKKFLAEIRNLGALDIILLAHPGAGNRPGIYKTPAPPRSFLLKTPVLHLSQSSNSNFQASIKPYYANHANTKMGKQRSRVTRGKGRAGPLGIRDYLEIGANLIAGTSRAAKTVQGIAKAFTSTGTQTKAEQAARVEQGTDGSTISKFNHTQRHKIAAKYEDMSPHYFNVNSKANISNVQTQQVITHVTNLFDVADVENLINDSTMPDYGTDDHQNSRDWLIKSVTCKTLFTSFSTLPAHCVLYIARQRESGSPHESAIHAIEEGLDEVLDAAGTLETTWGVVPEMSHRYKEHYETVAKIPFDLMPGHEHMNITKINLNKTWSYDKHGSGDAGANLPGFQYTLFVLMFGGLVTEDGSATEVAIGTSRVNCLTTKHYTFIPSPVHDHTVYTIGASVQDAVGVPKRVAEEQPAETAPMQP